LLDRGLGGDQVKSVKVGVKASSLELDSAYDHWTAKASAEMGDNKVMKAKVFGRLLR
jgi:outer membrane protein assembly factor BamA